MEITAAITIVTAVVAPYLIALLVRPNWTAEKKRNISLAVCGVLGVIVAIATGQIEGIPDTVKSWVSQLVIIVGVVVSLSQGFYKALKTSVDVVEVATSPDVAV